MQIYTKVQLANKRSVIGFMNDTLGLRILSLKAVKEWLCGNALYGDSLGVFYANEMTNLVHCARSHSFRRLQIHSH